MPTVVTANTDFRTPNDVLTWQDDPPYGSQWNDISACNTDEDAAFIAAAHQDIPTLCDALEATWRRIAELEEAQEEARQMVMDRDLCE